MLSGGFLEAAADLMTFAGFAWSAAGVLGFVGGRFVGAMMSIEAGCETSCETSGLNDVRGGE